MKRFNMLVTAGVIGIIFLIIIPLPTFLLDFFFIINITLSFLILCMTMYIREALEFSIFPSILLITTLFRLGLNISSTRRILFNNGDAGQVVKTFGQFVIRGNVVIGFVIFLIIVLVQFIVITKGSERVAEVAARFTLDAMPGKQMAIDADLNSGLIDENQARTRRSKIQREADFFGSMDGATKFVKGDAIISIIITLINFIGGLIVGFTNHQGTFSDIMQIYTTATIGDGLVSQIPALLISVATGMIVTRSASENNLSEDVASQFLAQPKVIMIAGSAILCLVLIPGFPVPQILVISAIMIGGGYYLQKKEKSIAEEAAAAPGLVETEVTSEASFYKNIENVYSLLSVEQIEMEFGYSLIPLVDESSGGNFIDRVVMFRKQMAVEMGFVIPSVRIKDSGQLNPNQYSILLKGEEVARGDILTDHFLALAPGEDSDDIPGIETVDPAFHIPAKWISEDKKIQAELAGYTLIDPTSVIITHLSEIIKEHLHELLNRQEVNNLLENLKKTNSTIVDDTIPSVITVGNLQKVLANLLREGVPIRDMETIIETLSDYGSQVKDTDMLTEYVRQALKRTISHRFSEAGQMKVISLDEKIENMIMSSVKKMDTGSYLALDPVTIQKIINVSTTEIGKIKELVSVPIVLTSPMVRIYFKKLIDQFYPNVTVVSFSEIDNNIQIQALGSIALN
ncbi:flagellar biosynthesis protein FlhA [[Clostridium] symbiosum]|uniref:flagellar biosynthesis protein FlhA n=1 Tax=Clostridium symbiosum TaxID=1512 RepID=UPI001D08C34A|nr:flagellar biosynthesis protein FlhA [[Clostridium] symbiosum]MCB6609787.1 flagellar biosynthesis protein FlhA [[Clostridium] symbiosum]MCB6931257.1 flagellar biosynthesis protein FlhA [[Clostridium] symbiosum]